MFPSSTLQTLVPYITRGVGIGNITFPSKWNTNATQPPLRYTNPVAQQAPVYHQYTLPPPPNVPAPQAFDDGTKTSDGGKKKPAAKKQKTGTFDLSSLHKIVQTAFHEYHNHFDGLVILSELCNKSGIVICELEPHPTYGSSICYQHILGRCKAGPRNCRRKHVLVAEQSDAFVCKLCKQLENGRAELIADPPAIRR